MSQIPPVYKVDIPILSLRMELVEVSGITSYDLLEF